MKNMNIDNIIRSRKALVQDFPRRACFETETEGGCGVTGFCCSIPVRGKHIYEPSKQMHNRGNGRGGGIAAMGFDARMLGVSNEVLEKSYILQIAVLNEKIVQDLEARFVDPFLTVDFSERIPHVADYRDIRGLDVKPPRSPSLFCAGETGSPEAVCGTKRPSKDAAKAGGR